MDTTSKSKFIINVMYYTLIGLIIFILFKFLFAYLLPFIIGTVITIIVQKPANAISLKTNIKKGYCALFLVVLLYLILFALLSFIIFKLWTLVYDITLNDNFLVSNIGRIVDEMIISIRQIFINIPNIITTQISNAFKNILESIANIFTNFAKSIVRSAPMFLTSSLVTIIASCYIAKDYDKFKASVKSVLSDKIKLLIYTIRKIFKENVIKIITGYSKILLITFLELLIGLFFLRCDKFILYAALISILDLLPILGTGTFLIPWGIYSILISRYFFGAGLIVLYVIMVIVRNVIEPRIIGKQIGLHPLIALICVFIGLKLFGIAGVFLLPFLVMILFRLYEEGALETLLK